jgi:pyruvate kinase
MTRSYLTYSRDLGDFKHDLIELSRKGLYGLRLINKGKSTDEFISRIEEILAYNREHNLDLQLLIDLPGEKALIGNLGAGLKIVKGGTYILCGEEYGPASNKIPTINFLERIDRTKVFAGDLVSIADGEVEMKIVSMGDHSITCVAQNTLLLTSNRSFNIKGNKLPAYPISNQDQVLLDQIKLLDCSKHIRILVSFVTNASQVAQVKHISRDLYVISKIENVINAQDLDAIIQASDAVMLGRGDLVATSKMSDIFSFQKNIIEQCHSLNKELILATGLFGDLKNSGKPSISDILDFGFLRDLKVSSFLIAGSNAIYHPLATLDLISNFEAL